MPRVAISDAPVIPLRSGIEEVDAPNEPSVWAENGGGYDHAEVTFHGATWPDGLKFWPTFWIRSSGDLGAASDPVSLTPATKDAAVLSDVGTVTYDGDSMTDSGQTFSSVRPTGPGDPSNYVVVAHPASASDPAFFGWPDADAIPSALVIRPSHFGDDPDDDDPPDGWVGSRTPDGTVTAYAIRPPDVRKRYILNDLAGGDLSVTIPRVDGLPAATPGYFTLDIGVRFF